MVSVLSMLEPQKCNLLLALASACLFVRLSASRLLAGRNVSKALFSWGQFPGCAFYMGKLARLQGGPTLPEHRWLWDGQGQPGPPP